MNDDMGYMGAGFGAAGFDNGNTAAMDVLPVGYGQSAAQPAPAPAAQPTSAPASMRGIDVVPAGTPAQALPPGAPTLGPVAPGNDTNTPFWVGDGSVWPNASRGVAKTPFPTQPAPTAPATPPVLFAGPNFGAGWQPRLLTLKDGTVVQQFPDQSFLVVSTEARDLAPLRGKRITMAAFSQAWGRIYREVGNYVPPVLTALQSAVANAQSFIPSRATSPAVPTSVPSTALVPTTDVPEEGMPTWAKIGLGIAGVGLAVVVLRRLLAR